jgi:hypothetical protein
MCILNLPIVSKRGASLHENEETGDALPAALRRHASFHSNEEMGDAVPVASIRRAGLHSNKETGDTAQMGLKRCDAMQNRSHEYQEPTRRKQTKGKLLFSISIVHTV